MYRLYKMDLCFRLRMVIAAVVAAVATEMAGGDCLNEIGQIIQNKVLLNQTTSSDIILIVWMMAGALI